ncbi:MAG: twin-arginine translocase TatA/TatE family subunit [Pseudomonadota bacterium]
MGLGGISIWQLLIVLGIVVVIFGTGRLRSIGGDLGGALKGFRKAMNEDDGDGDAKKDAEAAPKLEADPPLASEASTQEAEKQPSEPR